MSERPEATFPCPVCQRQFTKSALTRHEPICRKSGTKRRKVFDSGKQRASGSDIPMQAVRKAQDEFKKNNGAFEPPKSTWREKHESFLNAIQSAKGVGYALKTGAPLPPPPKSSIPSDYVQCEFCGRHFNRNAAERHIPFCKEQQAKSALKQPPTVSKQMVNRHRSPGVSGQHRNIPQQQQPQPPPPQSQPVLSNMRTRAFSGGYQRRNDDYRPNNARLQEPTRNVSAVKESANQSRVPVLQHRRGFSPASQTRIPTYSKVK